MRLKLSMIILILSLALLPGQALSMSVFYDFSCDNCAGIGDPDFAFSFEFSQAAVDAGTFTGIAGTDGIEGTADDNILSALISSGVGNGYTNTLADLPENDGPANDRSNISIALSPDRLFIDDIFDPSLGGDLLEFRKVGVGNTVLSEGTARSYTITQIQDLNPRTSDNLINVTGSFQRRAASPNPVPEPSTMFLFGSGIAGLAAWRYRQTKKK